MRGALKPMAEAFQKNGWDASQWSEAQALEMIEAVVVGWKNQKSLDDDIPF